MRTSLKWVVTVATVVSALVIAGCGGSAPSATTPQQLPPRAAKITGAADVAALQAQLARQGKTLPDFLQPGATPGPAAQPGEVQPASYMTGLSLSWWLGSQSVTRGRTQWYEANLANRWSPTDVVVRPSWGDPDLYVFSPLRGSTANAGGSLKLVGYSVKDGCRDDQVGSFITNDFGGPGRFLIAVFGYTDSNYKLLAW